MAINKNVLKQIMVDRIDSVRTLEIVKREYHVESNFL